MTEKDDILSVSPGDSASKQSSSSRAKWGSQAEFILSCIGFSVGYGNLWRFPYLCMRNGGGAFLIPYFLFLLLCGFPLFYLELSLGQFSGLSPLSVWKLCPLFKGVGWCAIMVSGLMTLYYNLIITWVIYYFGMSLRAEVPWSSCDNPWNTPHCRYSGNQSGVDISNRTELHDDVSRLDMAIRMINQSRVDLGNYTERHGNVTYMDVANKTTTAAEEFWTFKVLNISSGIGELGGIKWDLALCLLVAWLMVYLCLCKGIRTSGKVVYVTATLPYLFLTILLVRGATLPGSMIGIKYYITPDWKRLLEFKVWSEACIQIFYSLGPAWGGLITLSSYNQFNHNCIRDSLIICVACCGTSFYAGFAIFSVLGFMASETGLPLEEVVTQGPGLAFIAYPQALAKLPISPLWAACFFLMLFTLGLDSQFAFLETVLSGFRDQFHSVLHKRKSLFTLFTCLAMLIVDLILVTRGGMYIFQIMDWYTTSITLCIIAICECIIVTYIYGVGQFFYDITLMRGSRPSYIWVVLWGFITPVILLVMLVVTCIGFRPPTYGDYVYPEWVGSVGWLIASVSATPIPLVALYGFIRAKGSFLQRLSSLLKPDEDWGPNQDKYAVKYKYAVQRITWKQRLQIKSVTSHQNHGQDAQQISLNSSEKHNNVV